MNLLDLLKSKQLNSSVLFGYYGGGNFGDELLLDVITKLFKKYDVQDCFFYYSNPRSLQTWHEIDNAKPVFGKVGLVVQMLKSKNIVIGGGGHWGLDMNMSVFLLTCVIFFMHMVLRKKVYLLGVGYYNSTNSLGHISAWLVGKSSEIILARDPESYTLFKKISDKTVQDRDIAFYLANLEKEIKTSSAKLASIAEAFGVQKGRPRHLFVRRRFNDPEKAKYNVLLEEAVHALKGKDVTLVLLEPRFVDPEGYQSYLDLQRTYPEIKVIDLQFKPLDFVALCEKYSKEIILVAPQYHAQLIARLAGATVAPIAYDNKVRNLLESFKVTQVVPAADITKKDFFPERMR